MSVRWSGCDASPDLTLNKGNLNMPKADREHTTARDTGRTRPDTITTPKRRGLLTGTLAALLTGTAAVATAKAAPLPLVSDDIELLRLCAEFDRLTLLERSYFRGGANYIADDDERDDALDEFKDARTAS
jgi:hypothetical protein